MIGSFFHTFPRNGTGSHSYGQIRSYAVKTSKTSPYMPCLLRSRRVALLRMGAMFAPGALRATVGRALIVRVDLTFKR